MREVLFDISRRALGLIKFQERSPTEDKSVEMIDKEQREKIHREMMQRKAHPYADIKGTRFQ